jgi:signal peptidase I
MSEPSALPPPPPNADSSPAPFIEPLQQPAPYREKIVHHHEVLLMAQTTLTFLVGALFVLTFIVQPYRIPSASMENTLLVGDFLLVNKAVFATPGPWRHLLAYEPVRRDSIIVFHDPVDTSLQLVKRVVGTPGDRVQIRNGVLYVDERPQTEPFALYLQTFPSPFSQEFPPNAYTDPGVSIRWWRELQRDSRNGELIVPPHRYFVLGDNRNDSLDSRFWGFVPRQNIVGQPFLVYFSIVSQDPEELALPQNGKLGDGRSWWSSLAGTARWNRILHIIR